MEKHFFVCVDGRIQEEEEEETDELELSLILYMVGGDR